MIPLRPSDLHSQIRFFLKRSYCLSEDEKECFRRSLSSFSLHELERLLALLSSEQRLLLHAASLRSPKTPPSTPPR